MKAVHWVRGRQEERELAFWLSLVAYEHNDHSINNRVYLLYLILFFSAWIFAVLLFFAGGGALILQWIDPADPVRAAIFLEVLLLGVWGVYGFWQALRRSPIIFSEQDETLLCHTPLNRCHVVIRWLLMPWLKSALPFWLAAVTLGFSVAEAVLPGAMSASRILEYIMYGLRAWLVILPIHSALFSLHWVVGVIRLQKDHRRRGLAWMVMPPVLAFFVFLVFCAFNPASIIFPLGSRLPDAILFPFQTAFSGGNVFIAWIAGSLFVLAALAVLYQVSGSLSLSRAAQETRQADMLHTAQRYGFSAISADIQTRQRLGVTRKPTRLPVLSGAGALLWKDIVQFERSFQLSSLFIWGQIFVLMLGLSFLSQPGSYALLIAVWVILTGQASAARLRSDLANYVLTRQLPVSRRHFLLYEAALTCLLTILISLTGLAAGSIIFSTPLTPIAALIPGIIASTASLAAFDVIRQSHDHLLMNGSVPQVSAGGVILGVIAAGIPILIQVLLPGPVGLILSILLSLVSAWLAFNLAVMTFRVLDTARQG